VGCMSRTTATCDKSCPALIYHRATRAIGTGLREDGVGKEDESGLSRGDGAFGGNGGNRRRNVGLSASLSS
jgi:hypothetical protein